MDVQRAIGAEDDTLNEGAKQIAGGGRICQAGAGGGKVELGGIGQAQGGLGRGEIEGAGGQLEASAHARTLATQDSIHHAMTETRTERQSPCGFVSVPQVLEQ